jgi:hypothetical protein
MPLWYFKSAYKFHTKRCIFVYNISNMAMDPTISRLQEFVLVEALHGEVMLNFNYPRSLLDSLYRFEQIWRHEHSAKILYALNIYTNDIYSLNLLQWL